jgi:hypothetical protein
MVLQESRSRHMAQLYLLSESKEAHNFKESI